MRAYGERLQDAMDRRGPVCVGIDPHPNLLQAWGLPVSAAGARDFGLRVVEAAAANAAVVKPQSALFEAFGAAGVGALEQVLAAARAAEILSILDVKRGDIGSTMAGYARAYLGENSPLRADAMTVSPFLGFGSLRPCLEMAERTGRGIYVLALTSNPEGFEVQHALNPDGRSVARTIVERAADHNRAAGENNHMGSCGLVIGATTAAAAKRLGIDLAGANASLLAPGFGAQGAQVEQVKGLFADAAPRVLVAASRSLLAHGPRPVELAAAIGVLARRARACLAG